MRIILKDRVIETSHIQLDSRSIYAYMPNTTFIITMDSEGTAAKKMLSLGAYGFVDCTRYSYEEMA